MNERRQIQRSAPSVTAGRVLMSGILPALLMAIAAQAALAQGSGRSGKEVVQAVCASCHATGANGAPKIGDTKAWSQRASQGLTSLTRHALEGIRKMPGHGGSPGLSDLEIGAFAIAMRMKGESLDELIGFLHALHERLLPLRSDRPVIAIASYNGARRLPNLVALLALLLARAGARVLVHGQIGRAHV